MSKSLAESDKIIIASILEYIGSLKLDDTSTEIIAETLGEQTGVYRTGSANLKIAPFTLDQVFNAGKLVLEQQEKLFNLKMMPTLNETKYFEGTQPNSVAYNSRLSYARIKFLNRQVAKFAEEDSVTIAASQPAVTEPTDNKTAEDHKKEGNDFLAAKKYADAVTSYTKAINLNNSNAIYYANRALAHIELKQYKEAVKDCEESIRLDAKYSKSYYRLGLAQLALNEKDAVFSFEMALQFNSGDSSHITQKLNEAKKRFSPPAPANPLADPMGMGGMGGGMPGMGGPGGFDLAGLMSSLGGAGGAGGMPDLSALMKNPAVAEMAQKAMSDPNFMQNMMGAMGGAGGMPNMGNMGAPPTSTPAASTNTAPVNPMDDQISKFVNSPQAQVSIYFYYL